tara:strand:+ start:54 stop:242 length:189 start_codon:yes stop_codon:yes gene_type:complete
MRSCEAEAHTTAEQFGRETNFSWKNSEAVVSNRIIPVIRSEPLMVSGVFYLPKGSEFADCNF